MKRIQWAIEKKNNRNFTQNEFEYLTNEEIFKKDVVTFHILCQAIAIQFNLGSRESRLFIESQGMLILERLAKIPPMSRAEIIDEVLDEAQPVMNADSTSYVEWHQSGAVTALHVKATMPDGSRCVSGWITSGSYMFPYQLLPVTQHQSIVMAEREPQRYLSSVEIVTESGKHEEADILVNQPYSIGGWKIYQLNYDTTRGKWSEISVLELVRDPWLPYVYVGIYLMIAGAVLLLFTAQKSRE